MNLFSPQSHGGHRDLSFFSMSVNGHGKRNSPCSLWICGESILYSKSNCVVRWEDDMGCKK